MPRIFVRRNVWAAHLLLSVMAIAALPAAGQNWPQASGPRGDYVSEGAEPSAQWSVTTGENVLWRQKLPECGQSGIAVFGDKLFLTIKKPLAAGAAPESAETADAVGLCLDARTGKTLWETPIPGTKSMQYVEMFISEPTPIADESHVWFTTSSGGMVCLDHAGKEIWRRAYPVEPLHAAKFAQPALVDGKLINVEIKESTDPDAAQAPKSPTKAGKNSGSGPWSYLRAFDAGTGKPLWRSEAGTSIFSAPGIAKLGDQWVALHGRGGAHNPPEKPHGFTLTRLDSGEDLWSAPVGSGFTYFNSCMDGKCAFVFDTNALLALDMKTGKAVRTYPLRGKIDWYEYSRATQKQELHEVAKLPGGTAHPSYHSNILVGRNMLFMAHDSPSIGRVNLDTGKVEFLQVPYQVDRRAQGGEAVLWDKHVPSVPENAGGVRPAADRRTSGSGWGHVTVPSPISVNGKVYFVTMLGTVYVVDATADKLDASALKWVGDLGPAGQTWTLASLSYASGRLYARTLKDVVCIGSP